jgi:RHS repeat-associated protein
VLANTLAGPWIDEFFSRSDVTIGETGNFISGSLGTILAVANSAGAVQTEYTYDPFGNTTATGAPNSNSLQYTARENDSVGLYDYRARYYNPDLQRFINEDPIAFLGGDLNLYAYVLNNPVRWRDPRGLYTEVIFWEPVNFWGSWFGHVSTNINGRNFSFGPRGWDTKYLNAAAYAIAQQQFRGGTGVVLNLTPEQEKQFAQCLINHKDPYTYTRNNCGTPIQSCLNSLGVGTGQNRILPSDFYSELLDTSIFGGLQSYSGPTLPLPLMVFP